MANGLTTRKHFFKKAAIAALGIVSAPALFARGKTAETGGTASAAASDADRSLPVKVHAAKGTVVRGSIRS
ncbi:MAG: hypothetical protein EA353_02385 [Puniceicoccaceae bacterium]|nr:MAG: hypothetical protein EA353_02385 [Puniceicoccaceae bacterium]